MHPRGFDPNHQQLLDETINTLRQSERGEELWNSSAARGVVVRFAAELETRVEQNFSLKEGGQYRPDEPKHPQKEILLNPANSKEQLVGHLAHELAHDEQRALGHLQTTEEMFDRNPNINKEEYVLIQSRHEANAAVVTCEVTYELHEKGIDSGPFQTLKESRYYGQMAAKHEELRQTRGENLERPELDAIHDEVANRWHRTISGESTAVARAYKADFELRYEQAKQSLSQTSPPSPSQSFFPSTSSSYEATRWEETLESPAAESKPRVIFDRGVFLNGAAQTSDFAVACLNLVRQERAELLLSPQVAADVRAVLDDPSLQEKFPALRSESTHILRQELASKATVVAQVPAAVTIDRDRQCEPYLDLALAGDAHFLVTSNQTLLDLMKEDHPHRSDFSKYFPSLTILKPADFPELHQEHQRAREQAEALQDEQGRAHTHHLTPDLTLDR